MHCEQPRKRPAVPRWILDIHPKAVVRKARVQHYCSGRVTNCSMEIEAGDFYVAPGMTSYGVGDVWCLHCSGLRVQKTRVVNLRNEECDVQIDRSSKWGNPYRIGPDGNRDEVCDKYERYLLGRVDLLRSLEELRGLRLGCWCKPLRCHGDILVRFLEKGIPWRKVPKKRIRK